MRSGVEAASRIHTYSMYVPVITIVVPIDLAGGPAQGLRVLQVRALFKRRKRVERVRQAASLAEGNSDLVRSSFCSFLFGVLSTFSTPDCLYVLLDRSAHRDSDRTSFVDP